jgi:ABC-type transporter Mla subunit MlaD
MDKHVIKVGSFVILSIIILIFVIFWINRFEMAPSQKFYARFDDAGTLGTGASILYRGVKAGNVSNITITENQKYALVHISITNQNIELLEGSTATIVDKGFTGTKALIIEPPEVVEGKKQLKPGAVILGKKSFNYEEIQKLLARLAEGKKLENLVAEGEQFLVGANDLIDDVELFLAKFNTLLDAETIHKLDHLLADATTLTADMRRTSSALNEIFGDRKFSNDVKEAAQTTNVAMKNLNTAVDKSEKVINDADQLVNKTTNLVDKTNVTVDNIDKIIIDVDNTINNPELRDSIKGAMNNISDVMIEIKELTADPGLKDGLKGIAEDFGSLRCFTDGMSRTFSKRFLLPKMIFGKPGESLERCYPVKKSGETKKVNIIIDE